MDLIIAQTKALQAMTQHGLTKSGWTFNFDRATSRLGQTNFTRQKITISKHFTAAATEEQFEQTLLHEIAHALLPPFAKHGPVWKQTARSIGYKGGRTSANPYHEARMVARKQAAVQGAAREAIQQKTWRVGTM